MRRLKLIILMAILPFFGISQGIEIVPMGGYMFGGSVDYYEGKTKINDGAEYGISILIPSNPLMDIEVNYTRMDSKASFSPYFGFPALSAREATMATNYIQVGGLSKFYRGASKVTPFGSLSLGATVFSSSEFSNIWRFSATAGLGVKIMFSEKIGIMLRGRLLMPVNFSGTSVYFGTGGSGVSAGGYVAPFQGDFNGGLIFKLGN